MTVRAPAAALALALALLAVPGAASAAVFEPREFASPAEEQRYMSLVSELRCLVCQNQSIAESNADLAADLRRIVYDMIRDGASDEDIAAYMVDRYGDFVLYRPPLRPVTVLLWVGPFILLAIALALLLREVRRRRRMPGAAEVPAIDRERLAEVLGESGRDPPGEDRRDAST